MIVVSVPDEETRAALDPVPGGVRVVVWDLYHDPVGADLDEIAVVLVPHYQLDSAPFRLFADMRSLQAVQLPSAGFEHTLRYLPDGVLLCNGRGVHSEETAELAVGLVLATLRGIGAHAVNTATAHRWEMETRTPLYRNSVLIVGYGSVGAAIAARVRAFGARVEAVARSARVEGDVTVHAMSELPGLLPHFGVVILIVPLDASTRGLVDAEFLARMPDDAVLVNVARGQVVETDALLVELRSGRIKAALDVTDPEPLPPEHPLWTAPNLIITPHEGGNTTATFAKTVELMRAQIGRLAAGAPLENVVAG